LGHLTFVKIEQYIQKKKDSGTGRQLRKLSRRHEDNVDEHDESTDGGVDKWEFPFLK